MTTLHILGLFLLLAGSNAQRSAVRVYDDDDLTYEKPTTPVPILKQIDRHNDDGSYTYGFESADGSFKIETKEANGEVRGKYGYTDANGKLHVVEYGANKYGFMPSGEGITVPPVNFNAEPEPEEEQYYTPRPYKVKQGKKPIPRPFPIAYQPYEPAPLEVVSPVPQPTARPAPRLQNTPHIIYNSAPAPAPKRPQFFAGAQSVPEEPQVRYVEEPIAIQPRPAPKPQKIRYTSAPVPARTEVQFVQPEQSPSAPHFIPSAQFSSAIQFSDPRSPQPASAFRLQEAPQPVQYFRPEPAKAQLTTFPDPEQEEREIARPAVYQARQAAPKPSRAGGFLDQLSQQYSLGKSSGHTVADVSFGFY